MNESNSSQGQSASTSSSQQIEFTYEQEKLTAFKGDSLASALVRNAKLICRRTEEDQPRGIFCGMGVCNECQVKVDGRSGVLACMAKVEAGDCVDIQEQHRSLAHDAPGESLPEITLSPTLLIVGAGPAGLSLAQELNKLGLAGDEIVIIDERKSLGGQYFKQPQLDDSHDLDSQFREGASLIDAVRATGVQILSNVTVWGAFDHDHLAGYDDKNRYIFKARELVLATGAYERGIPMPGWTLPGVMTTGAAQTLLRSYGLAPGKEVLISGNGPLNLQMAAELSKHGAKVVALIESARIFSLRSLALTPLLGLLSPSLALKGLGYFLAIKRAKVPYLSAAAVSAFEGSEKVESAAISQFLGLNRKSATSNLWKKIDQLRVDAVAMGFGFISSNELARNLRCQHRLDPQTLGLKTVTNLAGKTTKDHIWVIGDSASINGAQVAKYRGRLLAQSLARVLHGKRRYLATLLSRVLLYRHLLFQKVLWQIYRSPRIFDQFVTAETVICRCLSITRATLEADLRDEMNSAGALKRVSRVGMGKCQGRYCSPFAQNLIADLTGSEIDPLSGFAPQVPVKPTSISTIAYS